MNLKEFIDKTTIFDDSIDTQLLRPTIFCKDGENFSLQCSDGHYCIPRINKAGKYTHVEIGCMSFVDTRMFEYSEDEDCFFYSTYAYVPIELIEKIIQEHGGIDISKTFRLYH